MAENNQRERVTEQLRHLSIHPDVYETDRALAQRCLRLLEQPLPLTVFGTDPTYALALANLMIGRTLLPTATERANLTLMHSEDCYVDLQLPDNSYAQLEQDNFPALFQLNPTQACVYADLPVLNKLTIQIAVDHNPATLAAQAAGALLSAEIALWAGGTLTQDLAEVWSNVPAQLRAHSYLVQPPELNPAPWQAMIPEFADVIQVDPERAQRAKTRPEGVDKAAFKAAGGVQLVKTIKKEIDALTQSAMDAGEILLVRHADKLTTATAPAPQTQATASQPTAPVEPVAPDQEPAAEPTMDAQSEPDPAVETLPRADAVVLDIEIDDEGYFDPDVMAEYQRQYPDLDRKIAHLYTRGASMKAIQQEIQDQQGVFVSVNLILVAAATVTELYSDSSDPTAARRNSQHARDLGRLGTAGHSARSCAGHRSARSHAAGNGQGHSGSASRQSRPLRSGVVCRVPDPLSRIRPQDRQHGRPRHDPRRNPGRSAGQPWFCTFAGSDGCGHWHRRHRRRRLAAP